METLYIRPAGSNGCTPWEKVEESQDPDSFAAAVFDLWDQGIREVSLDLTDYEISDEETGPSAKERLRVMFKEVSLIEESITRPDYRGKTREEITDARHKHTATLCLVDNLQVAVMKLIKNLEEV